MLELFLESPYNKVIVW